MDGWREGEMDREKERRIEGGMDRGWMEVGQRQGGGGRGREEGSQGLRRKAGKE